LLEDKNKIDQTVAEKFVTLEFYCLHIMRSTLSSVDPALDQVLAA